MQPVYNCKPPHSWLKFYVSTLAAKEHYTVAIRAIFTSAKICANVCWETSYPTPYFSILWNIYTSHSTLNQNSTIVVNIVICRPCYLWQSYKRNNLIRIKHLNWDFWQNTYVRLALECSGPRLSFPPPCTHTKRGYAEPVLNVHLKGQMHHFDGFSMFLLDRVECCLVSVKTL